MSGRAVPVAHRPSNRSPRRCPAREHDCVRARRSPESRAPRKKADRHPCEPRVIDRPHNSYETAIRLPFGKMSVSALDNTSDAHYDSAVLWMVRLATIPAAGTAVV
jgi:hypothetical protein